MRQSQPSPARSMPRFDRAACRQLSEILHGNLPLTIIPQVKSESGVGPSRIIQYQIRCLLAGVLVAGSAAGGCTVNGKGLRIGSVDKVFSEDQTVKVVRARLFGVDLATREPTRGLRVGSINESIYFARKAATTGPSPTTAPGDDDYERESFAVLATHAGAMLNMNRHAAGVMLGVQFRQAIFIDPSVPGVLILWKRDGANELISFRRSP